MSSILICGAKGQLGQSFRKVAPAFSLKLTYTDVDELDMLNRDALDSWLKRDSFDFIVNCAAYTQVDRAEEDEVMAERLNREIPANLRSILQKIPGTRLVHISTDYVYTDTGKVHKEDDPLGSPSVYGRSKLAGERELQGFARAMIIRTSWLHSEFGNNFVRTMVRLMAEEKDLRVVADQQGNPTYAPDLAAAILEIISKICSGEKAFNSGVYNFSNEGITSWHGFAAAIKEIGNFGGKLEAIPSSAYPTPAARPFYSALDKSKIREIYGLDIPGWRQGLERGMNELLK